jgi:CBS domain-containing protein
MRDRIMSIVGIPTGGFKTVGQIIATLGQGKELCNLVAEDMMRVGPIAVHGSTTLAEAAKRMEERGVLNVPVEEAGRVAYSVSRHDLLREWVAPGLELF